jgi:hypothetical protein
MLTLCTNLGPLRRCMLRRTRVSRSAKRPAWKGHSRRRHLRTLLAIGSTIRCATARSQKKKSWTCSDQTPRRFASTGATVAAFTRHRQPDFENLHRRCRELWQRTRLDGPNGGRAEALLSVGAIESPAKTGRPTQWQESPGQWPHLNAAFPNAVSAAATVRRQASVVSRPGRSAPRNYA